MVTWAEHPPRTRTRILEHGAMDQFGRYEITEVLGRGDQVVTYKAWDPLLERTLAIKVLTQPTFDEEARHRFFIEARKVACLDSPYILKLYDIGIQADLHYIVLEFTLAYYSLADSIRRDPDAVEHAGQLFQAMAHAHNRGVVHGRLEPECVMVASEGIKVRNFVPRLTTSPTIYTAPEQAYTCKADIFSLGMILWQLGNPGFAEIAARASSQRPDDRFESVYDLHCAFNAVRNLPTPPREPVPPARQSDPPHSPPPYPA